MTDPGEELRRILGGLPREAPPGIPLERLLLQVAVARRRSQLVVASVVSAGLLLAISARPAPKAPPVYFDIELVTVDTGPEFGGGPPQAARGSAGGDLVTDEPTEFDRP